MAPVEVRTFYDEQRNIMLVSFHGTLDRLLEIDDIANGIIESFKTVATQRFWLVADFTELRPLAEDLSATILVRKIHSRLGRLFKRRTLDRVVVARRNSFIKTFVSLLGAVIGKKAQVFDSLERAISYLEKQKFALRSKIPAHLADTCN